MVILLRCLSVGNRSLARANRLPGATLARLQRYFRPPLPEGSLQQLLTHSDAEGEKTTIEGQRSDFFLPDGRPISALSRAEAVTALREALSALDEIHGIFDELEAFYATEEDASTD